MRMVTRSFGRLFYRSSKANDRTVIEPCMRAQYDGRRLQYVVHYLRFQSCHKEETITYKLFQVTFLDVDPNTCLQHYKDTKKASSPKIIMVKANHSSRIPPSTTWPPQRVPRASYGPNSMKMTVYHQSEEVDQQDKPPTQPSRL